MAKPTLLLELTLSSPLLILLVVGFSCPEASGGGCDLQYLKTPPSEIMCNPYSSSAILILECQVQVLASVGSSRVDIQWFFNDTTSQAILHITDTESFPPLSAISYLGNQTVIDDDMWTLSSRITFSSLTSPTHQGMYVCQVALDGNIALFSPSDSLLIESEEVGEYLNFHPCSRMLFKDTMKCAGNISSSSTSSSTTLSLTTPISTLTTSVSTAAIPIATTSSNISLTVYFPIAVAAMFGMIMVVLSIISVGLCLKKMITSKNALNNSTNITIVQTGLSIKKTLEADDGMTMNEAHGLAPEPENDSTSTKMVQIELSKGNLPEADVYTAIT